MINTVHRLAVIASAVGVLCWPAAGRSNCLEPPEASETAQRPAQALIGPAKSPEETLQGITQLSELTRTAVQRSPDGRSAEHARAAAALDLEQTRAARKASVSLSASPQISDYRTDGVHFPGSVNGTASLIASGPIYDGGRLASLGRYRERLVEASSAEVGSVRERVVREAVLTALERNRYLAEIEVQEAHVGKLACLSGMIDRITEADRGRASEQVQARKALLEARINLDNARLALRQSNQRLEKLIGPAAADWSAIGRPLAELPSLESILAQVKDSPPLRKLQQQAEAQEHLADANEAERKPQVRWEAGFNGGMRPEQSPFSNWRGGVTLNYTIFDFGERRSAADAARERAKAARQTYEQNLLDRTSQAALLRDTAATAFQRAGQFDQVLRDSQRLRRSTYLQWATLGQRSLFDLISVENQHNQMQLSYVDSVFQGFAASVQLRELGNSLLSWLAPELATQPPPPPATPVFTPRDPEVCETLSGELERCGQP